MTSSTPWTVTLGATCTLVRGPGVCSTSPPDSPFPGRYLRLKPCLGLVVLTSSHSVRAAAAAHTTPSMPTHSILAADHEAQTGLQARKGLSGGEVEHTPGPRTRVQVAPSVTVQGVELVIAKGQD